MVPVGTYLLLLVGIVVGQIFRLPIRAGSDLSLRLADVVVAAISLVWSINALWQRLNFRRWPVAKLNVTDQLFLAFQIVLVVTFLLNIPHFGRADLLTGFGYQLRLQAYLLLYWVARSWGSRPNVAQWSRYLVWSAVVVAVIGFVQLGFFGDFRFMATFGWDPHVSRLLSTFYDPNFVGIYLGIGLTMAFAQALFGEASHRRWYWLLAVVMLVALYLTFSRSAIVSTAIAAVLLAFRRDWRAALLTALVFAVIVLAPGRLGSRFTDLFSTTRLESTTNSRGQKTLQLVSNQSDTGTNRIDSWKRAWAVIKTDPILGVGYNNYGPASVKTGASSAAVTGAAQSSDSSLLDIWATAGLIGLVVFLWWAVKLLLKTTLQPAAALADPNRVWLVGFGFGLLALGIDATFINSLLYPQLLIFWTLYGGLAVSALG